MVAGTGVYDEPADLLVSDTTGTSGVKMVAARSDHIHGMSGYGSPASVGTSLNAGSGETVARANHVHSLGSGSVNSPSMFASGVVGTAALGPSSVGNSELASGAVLAGKLDGSAVSTAKLQNDSVTTDKLADGAASGTKIGNVDASSITSGTLGVGRVPNLDASKFGTGTVPAGRIPDAIYTPVGSIAMHTTTSTPEAGEWLLCDGSAVSRATYSDLDTVLSGEGYPFGNGDGSTTFNVPDLVGTFVFGKNASGQGGADAIGDSFGSLDHTHSNPDHSHSATVTTTWTSFDGSHPHTNSTTDPVGNHTHTLGNTNNAAISGDVPNDGTSGLVSRNDISHGHNHRHSDGTLEARLNAGHSHVINNWSDYDNTFYAASRAHYHTHGNAEVTWAGGHSHTFPDAGSYGNHQHSMSTTGTTDNSGFIGGGPANPAYLAITFWIKT